MNTNLKLILLGLLAMLITIVVFTSVEAILVRPERGGETASTTLTHIPATPVVAADTTLPAVASSTATRAALPSASPAVLLTLPGEPFSTTTPTATAAVSTGSPEATQDPATKGTPSPSPAAGTAVEDELGETETPAVAEVPLGTSSIQGRVLFNGTLFSGTIVLKLVDETSNDVQQFTFMDGEYHLQDLQPSPKGYQIVFSREDNPQLNQNQVVRQVLVGPLPAADGALLRYPDFDIALQGLEPLEPDPGMVFDDHPITPQQPVRFLWSSYPSLSQYRLEIRPSRTSQPVWSSVFISTDSVVFDGVLTNGSIIENGTYWWSVSARTPDGTTTVIGPDAELILDW